MSTDSQRQTRNAEEFRAIAMLLRKSGTHFESRIHGTSMEPSIPDGARIRIGPPASGKYEPGQVVACVIGESLFAHRIVHCGCDRTGAFILTQGDGWLLCDPPTRNHRILGAVAEYSQGDAWVAPAWPLRRNSGRRIAARASFWIVRLSLAIHYEFARCVAGTFLVLGALCKRLLAPVTGHRTARIPRP